MTVVNEFDAVRIRQQVEADVIDTRPYNTMVIIPAGSEGGVVHVHGPRTNPVAYEVHFFVEALDCDAIATVDADLVRARQGAVAARFGWTTYLVEFDFDSTDSWVLATVNAELVLPAQRAGRFAARSPREQRQQRREAAEWWPFPEAQDPN